MWCVVCYTLYGKKAGKMNILEMTDKELYELGQKALADKLGADQVDRFIRQCKPGEGDYSVDRHKLLANQGDIDTIVARIRRREVERKEEERKRSERFNAPQSEIRKMTDIEIFEIGIKVLVDKLGVAGYWGFFNSVKRLTEVILLNTFKIKRMLKKKLHFTPQG